jgi:hypothetical protein
MEVVSLVAHGPDPRHGHHARLVSVTVDDAHGDPVADGRGFDPLHLGVIGDSPESCWRQSVATAPVVWGKVGYWRGKIERERDREVWTFTHDAPLAAPGQARTVVPRVLALGKRGITVIAGVGQLLATGSDGRAALDVSTEVAEAAAPQQDERKLVVHVRAAKQWRGHDQVRDHTPRRRQEPDISIAA